MLVKDAMHRRAVTIGIHETLPTAAVTMQELGVKRLPVVQDGKVIGILTDGEVKRRLPSLREGLSPWEFAAAAGRVHVREAMRQPAHTVTPETPLDRAITTMLDRHVGGLPVVDEDGGLLGMLTLTDVLRAEVTAPRLRWGAAQQHMTREVITVNTDTPAGEAAAQLRSSRLRVLPVLENGILAGLLHEVDVSAAAEREGAAHGNAVEGDASLLQGKVARDLMRPPSGHLREAVPMRDALSQMLALDVHGLPVVDGEGHLLGVVTISDVLKTVLGQVRSGADAAEPPTPR
ncbi:CBS domain-containing protein [Deinococcus aerophilus]|uniref:CBS domain-containing protein n=1 Tax=Deinococcus aerophilus TaxID=522488 RepID=A0ABQ2GTA0_9DEIO|nr:CBS domain-containing protein [Deinococcus aerophilus]GGM10513.1 hypothetical protein GCM10010841_18710 [Deinococcus aerophilus]